MDTLHIETEMKEQMIDITNTIQENLTIENGFVYIYCPHTTAGLTINENADPDVRRDVLAAFDQMIPKIEFVHQEGNSPAHIKSILVGKSVQVAVENGKMHLGTWDGIYFCEFDGPRNRTISLKEWTC